MNMISGINQVSGKKGGAMNKDPKAALAKRRDFLKLAGVGTLSGAAAAAIGTADAEAKVESETAAGYRETPHVRQVYDLSRF